MQYSSHIGEKVLDLFSGFGSTLMGAVQTLRHAFLLELRPLYLDVIVQRWKKSTGRQVESVTSDQGVTA
jgi:DNA modification methylase